MARKPKISEFEVLRYLKARYSYRNIAGRLGISIGSVSRIANKYGLKTVTKESLQGYLWEFACKKYLLERYPLSDLKFNNYMFEYESDKWKRYIPDVYIESERKVIEFKLNCTLSKDIVRKIRHYLKFADKVEFWFKYGKFSDFHTARNLIINIKKEFANKVEFKDMSQKIRI